MKSISLSRIWVMAALSLLSVAVAIPKWIQMRDDAVLLAYPRPPMPEHGRIVTILHDDATMAKIAAAASDEPDASSFASSFDMYYEALLDDCDPTKNAVIIGGTNGASWLMHPLVNELRARGYCTLNFDHRVHGRSSSPPGELSIELLGEDAAKIIELVFGGRSVNIYGWSLGGAVGYYLALEYPELVKSLTLQGVTSCLGQFAKDDGTCDTSFHFLKWLGSRDLPMRMLGTEQLGKTLAATVKMHDTDETMRFFRTLSTATMTRTPRAWNRWRSEYYHERIRQIDVPVLLLAGEYDALMASDNATMKADADRISGPAEYTAFPGFSHFMMMEQHAGERGADLIATAFASFHNKHFDAS